LASKDQANRRCRDRCRPGEFNVFGVTWVLICAMYYRAVVRRSGRTTVPTRVQRHLVACLTIRESTMSPFPMPKTIFDTSYVSIRELHHNQSFSAYADKCSSSSFSLSDRHNPRVFTSSSSLVDTMPISTSPALKSVAWTVESASMASYVKLISR
jgi:hypothetical protein